MSQTCPDPRPGQVAVRGGGGLRHREPGREGRRDDLPRDHVRAEPPGRQDTVGNHENPRIFINFDRFSLKINENPWIFMISQGVLGNLGVYLIQPPKICVGLPPGNEARRRRGELPELHVRARRQAQQ